MTSLITATHCPHCLGRFMLEGDRLFCINCSYEPRITPLPEWEEEQIARFDYRNKPRKTKYRVG